MKFFSFSKYVFSRNATLDQNFSKSSQIYKMFSRYRFNELKNDIEDMW